MYIKNYLNYSIVIPVPKQAFTGVQPCKDIDLVPHRGGSLLCSWLFPPGVLISWLPRPPLFLPPSPGSLNYDTLRSERGTVNNYNRTGRPHIFALNAHREPLPPEPSPPLSPVLRESCQSPVEQNLLLHEVYISTGESRKNNNKIIQNQIVIVITFFKVNYLVYWEYINPMKKAKVEQKMRSGGRLQPPLNESEWKLPDHSSPLSSILTQPHGVGTLGVALEQNNLAPNL